MGSNFEENCIVNHVINNNEPVIESVNEPVIEPVNCIINDIELSNIHISVEVNEEYENDSLDEQIDSDNEYFKKKKIIEEIKKKESDNPKDKHQKRVMSNYLLLRKR